MDMSQQLEASWLMEGMSFSVWPYFYKSKFSNRRLVSEFTSPFVLLCEVSLLAHLPPQKSSQATGSVTFRTQSRPTLLSIKEDFADGQESSSLLLLDDYERPAVGDCRRCIGWH